MRYTIAISIFSLTTFAVELNAFNEACHRQLTHEAWNAVQGLEDFLDLGELTDEIAKIDSHPTNNNVNQYRHSMRSSNQSLSDATRATAGYVNQEMDLAVLDAKNSRRGSASRHIARILHAVQDEKHDWSSCNDKSNGSDSGDPCSNFPTGCPPGKGHHGLDIDCGPGPQNVTVITNFLQGNFQLKTDLWPPEPMKDAARQRSIARLQEFMQRVKQP